MYNFDIEIQEEQEMGEISEVTLFEKEESKKELKRNIIIGSVLRKIHRDQGTMPYLIQVIEPYLKKADRKLFSLPF